MNKVTPYFTFNGNASEAISFYVKIFNADIETLQTFGDAKYPTPPEMDDRVMHARIKKDDLLIMFSDTFNDQEVNQGNNISLALELTSEEEIIELYDFLREDGNTYMELQDTFWGAKFAKVHDKFGIIWDLNYTKET